MQATLGFGPQPLELRIRAFRHGRVHVEVSFLWFQVDIHIAPVQPIAVVALCNLSMHRREQERLVQPVAPSTHRALGILVHIFDPIIQDFDKAITENKTPWSALHRNVPRVDGEHMQAIMRSVCGQLKMDKPLEDMGFDTIAHGIVVASKVKEYRRALQLPRNLCVSVCGT